MSDRLKSEDSIDGRIAELRHAIQTAEQELQHLTGVDREIQRGIEDAQRTQAQMQMHILDSLPAHIAILNSQGVIVAVNEAWRRFASANILQSADFCVGHNYLDICTGAHGECADEAPEVTSGLRRVLRREVQEFALEYPCHSPTEKRWFRLMVAGLSEKPETGVVVMHVNVTDRRLAEDDLRKLNRAVEQSPATIVITDLAGNIEYVNPKFTEATGYSGAEVIGKNPRILQSGETSAEIFRDMWATITAGKEWRGEMRNRKKTGETYWEEASISPVLDGAGKATHFLAVKENITERKRGEMVRVLETRVLEAVSSGAPLADILTNVALGIEEAIPGALACILLLDADGTTLRRGAAPNLPETYIRELDGVLVGPAAGSCNTAIDRREMVIVSDIEQDPLWRDFRDLAAQHRVRACWSVPVFNPTGGALAAIAVYSREKRLPGPWDLEAIRRTVHITGIAVERDRREKELHLLDACVSRLNDIILITEADPVDDPGPRILYVNDAFVRRTGYTREEAIGKTPRMLQGPKTQRDALDRIRAALKVWQPVREELINYTKSGEEFWLELDIVPVANEKGWFTHWVAVERDISDRKQAQQIIAQSQADKLRAVEQLRESAVQYRLLFDHNPQPMWVYDGDTLQFLAVNRAAIAQYGYSEDEFLAMSIKDIRPAEDVPRLVDKVFNSADRRQSFGTWRHRKKNGTLIDAEIFSDFIAFNGRPARLTVAFDITERLRARADLETSEAEFRNLAEVMPQIVWVTRPDGWNIYFNQKWMDYTGLSLQESLGHGWNKPFHPNDQQRAWEAWQHATSTVGIYSLECRLRRADGEYRWWLIRGEPQRDATGKVLKWFGTCTDIHALKQADLEISRTNRALKLLSACNEAMIRAENSLALLLAICRMAVDIGGYRMAWVGFAANDADCSITPMAHAGADVGYLTEVSLSWNANHPRGQGPAGQCIQRGQSIVCKDILQDEGFAYSREAARLRGYRGVICLPLIEGGRTFGLLGLYTSEVIERNEEELKLLQDLADDLAFGITYLKVKAEQQEADAKVREQAALLDSAHEAIMVKDMEERLVYWNKGAQRIYGWTAEEAIGRNFSEMLSVYSHRFRQAQESVLEKGEWTGEMVKRAKSGREVAVEVRWTLVRDSNGRPKAVLAIDSDVTEKKKMEAQFLRAQRMESIGTLAGGIAHDLNNVLAPIVMSIELLQDIAKTEEHQDLLETLMRSALRGADLVKQLLMFARGAEGERLTVNLLHLLMDLVKILRDTFPKNIRVEFQPPRSLWTVSADPTQIHQVILNLCVNARDAMPNGGKLNLAAKNIIIDDTYSGMNPDIRPGPYVVLEVEDNGTGVPLELQERIFEPFFTTKDVGKGTGLGLSTTMAITKSHGGFIVLASEPEKGAKFQVYLPADVTEGGSVGRIAEKTDLPRGRGEWILVVDDEESVRILAQSTLQRFGYSVMLASNGTEAFSLYAQHREKIALVLTDMAMPIMDGSAFVIALESINPTARIICSSGLPMNVGNAKAIGVSAKYFLPKPYTAEVMLKTIFAVLHGE